VISAVPHRLGVENTAVLEVARSEYGGTVLIVSHEHAFLREVATRVRCVDGTTLIVTERGRPRRRERNQRRAVSTHATTP
jgi:ATP-binding cassette subfamily F protein 3